MNHNTPLPSFSEAEIKKVLGTPEGQALLKMLNRDGGALLRQAANAVKNGDVQKAQDLVRPIMTSPDAAKLIAKLNQK